MEKIGFIGVGKIGLPICDHLIKKGYRVSAIAARSLADFEKLGGVPAKSPADVGRKGRYRLHLPAKRRGAGGGRQRSGRPD